MRRRAPASARPETGPDLLAAVPPALANSPAANSPALTDFAAVPAAVSPAVSALAAAPTGDGAAALRLALRLAAEVPPARFDAELAGSPSLAAPVLAGLASALGAAGDSQAAPLGRYLSAAAMARARRLATAGRFRPEEIADLVRLQVLSPERLGADARLRERVLAILPGAFPSDAPAPLRERALGALCALPGMSFESVGPIERAWGAVPREAAGRWSEPGPPLRFDADTEGSLAATVFSFPSSLIEPAEAQALLAAVRRLDPGRELLVLADLPLRERLAPAAPAGGEPGKAGERPGVTFLDTCGRPYSPWPRDPFSLVRGPGGQVTVLVRPNLQPGREADATLGPELVQGLPPRLDAAWGGVRWTRAPVPFHNGQVLLAPRTAWVSLHTLEPRILEILGLPRVPVASFGTAAGIDRYLAAAERARGELAALYGRPVAFVHPLPAAGPEAGRAALMREIGGGAGYDLDSLLTLLPGEPGDRGLGGPGEPAGPGVDGSPSGTGRPGSGPSGAGSPVGSGGPGSPAGSGGPDSGPAGEPHGEKTRALVADLGLGRGLLARLPAADWEALRRGYGLAPEASRLPALLAAAQETPRAQSLARYLDLVAGHLRAQGMEVTRLPLLLAPLSLLRDAGGPSLAAGELLLGWNNVVVEVKDGRVRAEGFASLLPTADGEARAAFARAGCRLDLLPPLVESVLRGGGYRCASNHLRVPSAPTPAPAPASRPAGPRRP